MSAATSRLSCRAERQRRRLLIVRRAMLGLENLSVPEKIEIYLAAADVLPRKEAEAARETAFVLRASEAKQLAFREMLGDGGAK